MAVQGYNPSYWRGRDKRITIWGLPYVEYKLNDMGLGHGSNGRALA
jgi:hypothetical protein